jgi:hypothetical protein
VAGHTNENLLAGKDPRRLPDEKFKKIKRAENKKSRLTRPEKFKIMLAGLNLLRRPSMAKR